ncbi:MAG: hypothetical protein ACKVX7_10115 [Planctomycetota bacterium]
MSNNIAGLRAASCAALLIPFVLCGCFSFYRHKLERADFQLFSDVDPIRLTETTRFLESALPAMHALYPTCSHRVPAPRVVYNLDELAELRIVVVGSHQDGYYLPFLHLIHLSPQTPPTDAFGDTEPHARAEAESVILHELSHHFLISVWPATDTCYWLNEGLACMIENGRLVGPAAGQFAPTLALPHYHPWLHQEARAALEELGRAGVEIELGKLLTASWNEFHEPGRKMRNYALSWSAVEFLYQQLTGTFESRVQTLAHMKPDEVLRRTRGLADWIATSQVERLRPLARDARFRRWALFEWIDLAGAEPGALLVELRCAIASPSVDLRRVGMQALTRLLNRRLELPAVEREKLYATTAQALAGRDSEMKLQILAELRQTPSAPSAHRRAYFAPLIELLEDADPELRSAAALALAQQATKPTLTRPSFWSAADPKLRQAEVAEWRQWLRTQAW